MIKIEFKVLEAHQCSDRIAGLYTPLFYLHLAAIYHCQSSIFLSPLVQNLRF